MKALLVLAALVTTIGGGAYLVSARDEPDPQTVAVAEALALHTRAIKAAFDEECSEARKTLHTWRRLKKAGTPDPDDTKQARKTLRQMLKEGCHEHG